MKMENVRFFLIYKFIFKDQITTIMKVKILATENTKVDPEYKPLGAGNQ